MKSTKKTISTKCNISDAILFVIYILIFLMLAYFIYVLIRYFRTNIFRFELFTNYQSGMNKKGDTSTNLTQSLVQIENNFTNSSCCEENDVQYCAKLGKNAVCSEVGGGSCMCNEMESGV